MGIRLIIIYIYIYMCIHVYIYISRSSDCQFVDMYGHMAIDKSQLDIGTRR